MRINGTVNDDTDKALFDALSGVNPYKRMALLRRLANLGLLVEQGRLAAGLQVAPVEAELLATEAVSVTLPAESKVEAPPPSTPAASEPEAPVADRVVTAKPEKQLDANGSASGKSRGPNLALMRRMNLSIME